MVLICISLTMSDAEHLFMCFLAIPMSSLENCLFRSSTYFLMALFVFFGIELQEMFINFGGCSLVSPYIGNIFSYTVDWVFILFRVPLLCRNF